MNDKLKEIEKLNDLRHFTTGELERLQEEFAIFHLKFETINPFFDENDTLVKNAAYPQNAYKLRFSN